MKPKIRFIVTHYVSRGDIYGNRYWRAKIVSTMTGRALFIDTPHESNTWELMPDETIWAGVYKQTISDIPIRRFNSLYKDVDAYCVGDDEKLKQDIRNLEKEK
jgi:hypothetical protein